MHPSCGGHEDTLERAPNPAIHLTVGVRGEAPGLAPSALPPAGDGQRYGAGLAWLISTQIVENP
jgi:hypothetical protein